MTDRRLGQALDRIRRVSDPDLVEPESAFAFERRDGLDLAVSELQHPIGAGLSAQGQGNLMVAAYRADLRHLVRIDLVGDDNVVVFGACCRIAFANVTIRGSGNFIYFGAFATANDAAVTCHASGSTIVVGDRSMLSNYILIGRPDPIGLYDAATGTALERPFDIVIGDRCWIGRNVVVEPGAHVGPDCVVAQSAVVSGHHPGGSILAGIPAEIRRSNVVWARTNEPTYAETLVAGHAVQLYQRPLARLKARIAALRSAD